MRKINNPFISVKDYCCFGCSPNNKDGLKMEFFEDSDEIVSMWEPSLSFQGYNNILHGGIQSALMDEIAFWLVCVKLKTGGVTAKLEINLRKPVYINKGKITLRASLVELKRKIAKISVKLFDAEDMLCADGFAYYFTFSHEESVKKLMFPEDISVFYEK